MTMITLYTVSIRLALTETNNTIQVYELADNLSNKD